MSSIMCMIWLSLNTNPYVGVDVNVNANANVYYHSSKFPTSIKSFSMLIAANYYNYMYVSLK